MSDTARTIVAFQGLSSDALRDVRTDAVSRGSKSVIDACDYLLRNRAPGHQRIADSSSGTLTPYDASLRDRNGNVISARVGFTGDPMVWMRAYMSGGPRVRINTNLVPGDMVPSLDPKPRRGTK